MAIVSVQNDPQSTPQSPSPSPSSPLLPVVKNEPLALPVVKNEPLAQSDLDKHDELKQKLEHTVHECHKAFNKCISISNELGNEMGKQWVHALKSISLMADGNFNIGGRCPKTRSECVKNINKIYRIRKQPFYIFFFSKSTTVTYLNEHLSVTSATIKLLERTIEEKQKEKHTVEGILEPCNPNQACKRFGNLSIYEQLEKIVKSYFEAMKDVIPHIKNFGEKEPGAYTCKRIRRELEKEDQTRLVNEEIYFLLHNNHLEALLSMLKQAEKYNKDLDKALHDQQIVFDEGERCRHSYEEFKQQRKNLLENREDLLMELETNYKNRKRSAGSDSDRESKRTCREVSGDK